MMQSRTISAGQRKRFRDHWARLSGKTKPGRPSPSPKIRQLIRETSKANPHWGSPRIVGELERIGIIVAESKPEGYMIQERRPPSATWRAFLKSQARELVSIDLFVVSTVRLEVLLLLIVLAHHRRRTVRFGVTEHPTTEWTAEQIVNAFPWDDAPRYLLRDRDSIHGVHVRERVQNLGIAELLIAPRSPWQSPFAERVIGSIRRDCLTYIGTEGPTPSLPETRSLAPSPSADVATALHWALL